MPWRYYVSQLCDILCYDQYQVTTDVDVMYPVTKF